MEVVSLSPVYVASLPWRRDARTWMLTVVCKATFDLIPGEMRLSQQQDPISDHDQRWEDEPGRSVHAPGDMAPFKGCADVTLIGHAFAPQGKPVRQLVARLSLGSIDKSITVHGDRAGRGEAAPFSIMALRYERAAGGPGTSNPAGIPPGGDRLPNLEPLRHGGEITPAGFGPIAADWPERRARWKANAPPWSPGEPLPDDVDALFFNLAPADQQLSVLRDDQPMLLENLHPDHPRLSTRLPGLRPQAFVERSGAAQEVDLRADGLWIDTDRGRCAVTWRAQIPLAQRDEPGRLCLAFTSVRQQLTWEDMLGLEQAIGGAPASAGPTRVRSHPELAALHGSDEEDDDTMTLARKLPMPVLPPRRTPAPPPRPSVPSIPSSPPVPAATQPPPLPPPAPPPAPPPLPASAPPPLPTAPPPPLPAAAQAPSPPSPTYDLSEPTSTDFYVVGEHTPILDASPAWLVAISSKSPAIPMATPTPIAQPIPPPAPSGVIPQPPPSVPIAAAPPPPISSAGAEPKSPWAAASSSVPARSPVIAPAPAPVVSAAPSKPAPKSIPSRTPTLTGTQRPSPDVLDLLWFDPESLPRIRSRWGAIVDELEFEPLDPRHDLPVDDPAASRDRHHAFGVLTQAAATDAIGVSRAMGEAVSDRGRFTPPLVVVAGELRFPFDEIETLKAAAAAAKPLAKDDKRLTELLDTINELMGTPLLQGAPGAIDSLLRDLSGAVAQAKRPLPVKYLDAHLERVLLEQRRYQKRTVFGGPSLRALLTPAGSSTAIPAYLPEDLADKLPLVIQMKVKLIAEASPSQDQYESHPHALRVVALGRAVSIEGWRR